MEAIPSKGTREVDDASDFGDIGALGDLFYEARRANLCKPRPCLYAVGTLRRTTDTYLDDDDFAGVSRDNLLPRRAPLHCGF